MKKFSSLVIFMTFMLVFGIFSPTNSHAEIVEDRITINGVEYDRDWFIASVSDPSIDLTWIFQSSDERTIDGIGGVGGPGTGVRNIPKRDINDDSDCTSMREFRVRYATEQLNPYRNTLSNGQRIKINYQNGQSENFFVTDIRGSIPVIPIPNTCG